MSSITVDIFGESYTIKGEAESEYILNLSKYVDEKMQEVAQNTKIMSTLKISILAALNIADELFQLRETQNKEKKMLNKKASHLALLLEQELKT